MTPLLATYLRDAALGGWFDNATGALYTGFQTGPDDVVIDVGCGEGGFTGFCARQGSHVILVDIDANSIAGAAARMRETNAKQVEAYVSNCAPIPVADARATRIICTEVLEHVDDPAALMGELHRVAAPGALFLLSVPDPVIEGVQRQLAPELYWRKPNHLRVFGREDFAALVTAAGLTIEHRGSFSFYQALWWSLFWACGVPLEAPDHPVLHHLERAWSALLDLPNGPAAKRALDEVMPKSQVIVARKPG